MAPLSGSDYSCILFVVAYLSDKITLVECIKGIRNEKKCGVHNAKNFIEDVTSSILTNLEDLDGKI